MNSCHYPLDADGNMCYYYQHTQEGEEIKTTKKKLLRALLPGLFFALVLLLVTVALQMADPVKAG